MKWQQLGGWRVRARGWLVALFALVTLFGANAIWDYVEAQRVTSAIVAVGRSGGSINRSTIERSDAAMPADDAAPFYIAAAALASTNLPEGSVTVAGGHSFSGVPGPGELQAWYTTGDVPAADLQRTKLVVDRQNDALRLLDTATARQFIGFAPGTTYGAQIRQFEALCRLCNMRTVYAAANGDGRLATQSLLAELGLFADRDRIVAHSPVPRLLLSAITLSLMLNRATLSEAELASLALAFERADDDRLLERTLDGMRGGYIDWFLDRARYWRQPIGLAGLVAGSPAEPVLLPRPLVARRMRARLSAYAELIAASRRPWISRLDEMRTVAMSRQWRDDSGFLVNQGWSSGPWGFTALPLRIASARVARAAIAVERFRLAHHGQLPDTLDQTVPAFLPAVPIDPYSGRPIRFSKVDGGYQVYGVSFDRVDDGGDLVRDQPLIRVRR